MSDAFARALFPQTQLATLGDLEGLRTCTKLTMLSLLHNEVVNKQYYRLYAINLVPSLKQLDFQKVTLKASPEPLIFDYPCRMVSCPYLALGHRGFLLREDRKFTPVVSDLHHVTSTLTGLRPCRSMT